MEGKAHVSLTIDLAELPAIADRIAGLTHERDYWRAEYERLVSARMVAPPLMHAFGVEQDRRMSG